MSPVAQADLFGAESALPEGFRYAANVISGEAERALIAEIGALDLRPFAFHGYEGKRRVRSFGWRYDYERRVVEEVEPIPPWLLPLRAHAAAFAGLAADALAQALVTEYDVGAPIGWHRDKPEYGRIVGVSLAAPCTLRFRRRSGTRWERMSLIAEPRSAYLLSGAARTEWEHSIPPVERLRYSVTFRTLRGR